MKLFAYMITGEDVFCLLENGKLVERKTCGSVEAAKTHLQTAGFHQNALNATGGIDYDLLWMDDPAGDNGVLLSAHLYGERKTHGDDIIDRAYERFTAVTTNLDFDESRENLDTIILVVKSELESTPSPEQAIDSDAGTDSVVEEPKKTFVLDPPMETTVEIDLPPTPREADLVRMILEKQRLKIALAGYQAKMNKEIKELDRLIADYASGKSKTHAKARYIYHWSEGVRDVVVIDSGEIVRTEQIPLEFMQSQLNLDEPKQDSLELTEVVAVDESCNTPEESLETATDQAIEIAEREVEEDLEEQPEETGYQGE